MTRIALMLFALLCFNSAHAERFVWYSGSINLGSNNTTFYLTPLGARITVAPETVESRAACPLPDRVKLLDLETNVRTAPGAAKTRVATVYKTHAASAATLTYSGAADSGAKHYTTPLEFAQGDTISIELSGSGTPAASRVDYALVMDSGTQGESFYCGTTSGAAILNQPDNIALTGTNTGYCNGSLYDCGFVQSTPGRWRKLVAVASTPMTGSAACTLTWRDFGSDTLLWCTINAANPDPTRCSNVADDVVGTVLAPFDLNIDCNADAVALVVRFTVGVAFKATTPGLFMVPFVPKNNNWPNTGSNYVVPESASDTFTTTEANHQAITPAVRMKGMASRISVSPGLAKTWVLSVRDDGVSTSTACSISGATAKTCSSSNENAVAADSFIDWEVSASNTPASDRGGLTATAWYATPNPATVSEDE